MVVQMDTLRMQSLQTSTGSKMGTKSWDYVKTNATHGTYLGDVISETGTIDETVLQRTVKATGITSQFNLILSSISQWSFNYCIGTQRENNCKFNHGEFRNLAHCFVKT